MKLDEIYDKQWNIDKDLVIRYSDEVSLSLEEQECHFNIDRYIKKTCICCSYQSYINKLSKSSLVTIYEVLISRSESNIVLEITGVSSEKLLTIKKVNRTMSEEQKLILIERMKGLRAKKK